MPLRLPAPVETAALAQQRATSRRDCLRWAAKAAIAGLAGHAVQAQAADYDDYVRAIISDNQRAMVNLIFKGFDPNTRDTRGRPGLVSALHQDALEVFDVLLKSPGIRVNEASRQGETALMMACIKGHTELVKQLIARGADVNQPGWSPLHYAVSVALPSTQAIVRLLLDESAYIDAESPNGSTPLMLAAQYSNEEVVDLLLREGADVMLRNQQGLTAVDFASKADRQFMVQRLQKALRTERRTQPARGTW